MINVYFDALNKVECELVRHFVDLVKERINHVVLDLQLCEFLLVGRLGTVNWWLRNKSCYPFLK